MKTTQPLDFGEILDQTFRITKNHFGRLFMIAFLLMFPVYVIQAVASYIGGRSIIMSADPSDSLINQITQNIDSLGAATSQQNINVIISSLLSIIVIPIVVGATVYAVKHAREGEPFTVKGMIKKALPRYWPMFFSLLLVSLILTGILIVYMLLIVGVILGNPTNPLAGVFFAFFFGIGLIFGLGLLFTRWSMFLPAVLFEKVAPGFTKSWRLTKKQTWKFFGLFIILALITYFISSILTIPIVFLGNSVLSNFLSNLLTMITNIILTVGFAVMFFDARLRQEATDLQEMINQYDTKEQPN
ncbi:hypothetical protein J416_10551 [Gracilibacillus halophilus YIM-C55.5]|uniref:Glycerophosphoryl diester phosphodiesterase membrane domain-containing protein n=1 Tax=Gracilibacillus halophilus YIM-C55.5 TaxID=1308866 RepID=N4WTG9_9BACI|nr:hypothetical protein [Gracilibacillus halophilus]ENH96446.1 hypothetical protein J416_10551 [Gracilibacillus halophilus YIM-C55.5]